MPDDFKNLSQNQGIGDTVEEKLKEKMKALEIKAKEQEAQKKAAQIGVNYINFKGFPISPEILGLIPKEKAEELKVICFYKTEKEANIAAVDPQSPGVEELKSSLEKEEKLKVKLFIMSQHSFDSAFDLYKLVPKKRKIVKGVEITEKDLKKFREQTKTFDDFQKAVQEVPITDIVAMIIAAALEARSSDIHIEAEEKDIKVRFRVDGVLQVAAFLPKKIWPRVVARIKLFTGLKINITDKPQDGRFTIYLKDDQIDVRVSTLPTNYGESVVMRLLKQSGALFEFEKLGVRGVAYEQLKREVEKPNGMIITTGPTGSGKTTTLYAVLNKLNKPETKIITLENPVEYRLAGISQSQVDEKKGYTFADGLRSILRQDPDVVMVGEIRDLETANVAINAALTGHLVISTLHTNSAAGAVPRFLAMGVKPFLIAPALNAIIGQRLVRRVCEYCKEEYQPDEDMIKKIKEELSKLSTKSGYEVDLNNLKFYHGKGCRKCNKIGYKGRIGIYEIMTMNPEIEKLILSGHVSEYEMQDIAVKNGMVTMVQDGLLKALDGITSPEEVFRVAD